jgi:probable HAF family extracellular repeat protein
MGDLGTLGGRNSYAYALNSTGEVVGASDTPDGTMHAFVFHDGTMSDLGTVPGFDNSLAYGINDHGVIVGDLHSPGSLGRPFIYRRGVMTNLNDLIRPDSGFTLLSARAINDAGQIMGWGRYPGSTPDHAVLLTPQHDADPSMYVGFMPQARAEDVGPVVSAPLDGLVQIPNRQAPAPLIQDTVTLKSPPATRSAFIVRTPPPRAEPQGLAFAISSLLFVS